MITRRGKKLARASAVVEMAVVMPLLLSMVFGIIEYGWMMTVRQAMNSAAREGARTASLPGATDEDIQQRVGEVLNPLGLTAKATIDLTHSTDDNPVESVSIEIPYGSVTLVGCYFGSTDKTLRASCSMRKEGID